MYSDDLHLVYESNIVSCSDEDQESDDEDAVSEWLPVRLQSPESPGVPCRPRAAESRPTSTTAEGVPRPTSNATARRISCMEVGLELSESILEFLTAVEVEEKEIVSSDGPEVDVVKTMIERKGQGPPLQRQAFASRVPWSVRRYSLIDDFLSEDGEEDLRRIQNRHAIRRWQEEEWLDNGFNQISRRHLPPPSLVNSMIDQETDDPTTSDSSPDRSQLNVRQRTRQRRRHLSPIRSRNYAAPNRVASLGPTQINREAAHQRPTMHFGLTNWPMDAASTYQAHINHGAAQPRPFVPRTPSMHAASSHQARIRNGPAQQRPFVPQTPSMHAASSHQARIRNGPAHPRLYVPRTPSIHAASSHQAHINHGAAQQRPLGPQSLSTTSVTSSHQPPNNTAASNRVVINAWYVPSPMLMFSQTQDNTTAANQGQTSSSNVKRLPHLTANTNCDDPQPSVLPTSAEVQSQAAQVSELSNPPVSAQSTNQTSHVSDATDTRLTDNVLSHCDQTTNSSRNESNGGLSSSTDSGEPSSRR